MKEQFILQFTELKSDLLESLPKFTVALAILLLFYAIGKVFRHFFKQRLEQRWSGSIIASFLGSVAKWIFYFTGIALALYIMGFGGIAGSLLAGAGVSAIIIGFAFKDIAENFLAGILLALNRPFSVNDIVEIEGYKGTIRKLELRTTHMRMADGRDVFIPNSMIVKSVLTNYTQDNLIRQDFMVGLDSSDDIIAARKLILDYLITNKNVLQNPVPNVLTSNLGVNTVDITVYFWINVFVTSEEPNPNRTIETVKSSVMRNVKELLLRNGFSMPANIMELKAHDAKQPIPILNHMTNEPPKT